MARFYKLKCWSYPLSFLGAEMFSAFCGITGYKQEEGSTLYLYYMISLFAFSMLLIVHDMQKVVTVACFMASSSVIL